MIPFENQPPTYWATTLYKDPRRRPKADAPIRDLPQRAAQRFKRAREGIRALKHVTEQVVFMGTTWKRSEEHTSELQSQSNLVCRLLLEKKKNRTSTPLPFQHTISC